MNPLLFWKRKTGCEDSAALAAAQSMLYARSILKFVTTGCPCWVMYAGDEKYVCSMYCNWLTSACCGVQPEQESHLIAPWSIMMAKVNPG